MDYLIPLAACAVSAGIGFVTRGVFAMAYHKRVEAAHAKERFRQAENYVGSLENMRKQTKREVETALAEQAARAYTEASKEAYDHLNDRLCRDGRLDILPKAEGLRAIDEKRLRDRWEAEDAHQRHESYLWCAWQEALQSLGRACAHLTVEDVKLVQDARRSTIELTAEDQVDTGMRNISVVLPPQRIQFTFDPRRHLHD